VEEEEAEEKIRLKQYVRRGESHRFFWVGRLTANHQYFNLGLGFELELLIYSMVDPLNPGYREGNNDVQCILYTIQPLGH
jgi:hypothetical protein